MYYIIEATDQTCQIKSRFYSLHHKLMELLEHGKPDDIELAKVLAKNKNLMEHKTVWLYNKLYLFRTGGQE